MEVERREREETREREVGRHWEVLRGSRERKKALGNTKEAGRRGSSEVTSLASTF